MLKVIKIIKAVWAEALEILATQKPFQRKQTKGIQGKMRS